MEMVVRPRDVEWNKMKMPFMFLPYRIFAEWTNIAALIEEEEVKAGENPSRGIRLENRIRKFHRELHKVSWALFGLNKLKFIYPSEQTFTEASIFLWTEVKSKRIYGNATDFQRQFLFLPLPILEHATNIRDVAMINHSTRFPNVPINEENLTDIIVQVHRQMHKLNRWRLGKLEELRFLRPAPKGNRKGRPRKSQQIPKKNPSRDEQQPSTSQAYQKRPKTLVNPQKSIDSNLSTDDDDDAGPISRHTRKRTHETASNSTHSPGELAICSKKFKTTNSNRSVTSNHSNENESEREKLNTSNNTSISNTSGSTMHPKEAPHRASKRSQQAPFDKPTKVQRKMIEIDKNGFIEETNIKELIRRKYGDLTAKELQVKINYYFSLRCDWDAWERHDCLNDLALKKDLSIMEVSNSGQDVVNLISSDDDSDVIAAKKSKTSSTTKPGTSSELAGSSENAKKATSSPKSTLQKSSKPDKFPLTELQSKLYEKLRQLSLPEFIEKTNIKQLVQKEIEKRKLIPKLFEQNMKKGIDKMFKVIQRPKEWQNFDMMQQLEFLNVESDPSGSSRMNVNIDDVAPYSLQEQNNKSVQDEMSPINGDILSVVSEKGGTNELSSSAIGERVHEIPESQSQSMDNNGPESTAAVDESDVDMMDITRIPILTSTQTIQERSPNDQETQFDESSNAENLVRVTIQMPSNDTIVVGIASELSTEDKLNPDHILSMSRVNTNDVISDGTIFNRTIDEDSEQKSQQSNPAYSQSMHNSSADAASQTERNVDLNENSPVPIETSTPICQLESTENQRTHIEEGHNHELSNNKPAGEPINDGSTMQIKREPGQILPHSESIDSDVICDGTLNESTIVYTLQDTDDEMNKLMNATPEMNFDSDSFGILDQSVNQEFEAGRIPVEELDSIVCDEPSTTENVLTHSTTTTTIETTTSVENGSMMRSCPLQRIENTMNAKSPIFNQSPLTKRPIDKTSTKQNTTKQSKKTMDDTLSNIQPPKYDYRPLQLTNKQSNGTVHHTVGQKSTNVYSNESSIHIDDDVTLSSSPQIDSDHGTQPTQESQSNVIEEFDSSNEINELNAMRREQSQLQSAAMNLLTQDNTWFLNVNTQPINSPIPQPVTVNSTEKSIAEIASLLAVPSYSRQDLTVQYLHYVHIEKFESKLLINAGEQNLNITLHLKYQCNGGSKIVISGESPKFILKVTENEWKAINQVLNTIGDFELNLKIGLPIHKSILHRLIFYLVKSTSNFSKVHVEYSEQDYQTARIIHKTYVIDDVDVTPALDSEFLELLKMRTGQN